MIEAPLAASFDDVRAAAQRLRGVVHRTPVISSRTLDERTDATAFLKAESLQRIGAFKIRGAYNRIAQLDAEQRRRGVVAFSSGNHAQGVALAAKLLGVPATMRGSSNGGTNAASRFAAISAAMTSRSARARS